MRVKDRRFNSWFLWEHLRSPEARARLLSDATGGGRHRVSWDVLKAVPVPLGAKDVQDEIGSQVDATSCDLRFRTVRDDS
jgi:restriction endonuclease S subunit